MQDNTRVNLKCRKCEKIVTIILYPTDGYLEIENGNAYLNSMSDGFNTVDLFCDECNAQVRLVRIP